MSRVGALTENLQRGTHWKSEGVVMDTRAWFAAALALATSVPVAAQRVGDPIFQITVVAPRLIRQTVGHTNSGAKVELISLTRHVDYKDLDLKQQVSVAELETRVSEVAEEACAQLARVYPSSDPRTPDCVKDAVQKAMEQVRAAVAAANK
jgi:UrcA family protein